ncbi:hypothetical protein [Chlamydiifrater phoenicopteri]|uniref:hypothetical protein n=1 Tax=Chlamydiifrater phoenicopteri TaxID=2681469 RepID=UPI001BD0AA43|nr:hypothetical protein [Chlamydiifrater phoenicopteri]
MKKGFVKIVALFLVAATVVTSFGCCCSRLMERRASSFQKNWFKEPLRNILAQIGAMDLESKEDIREALRIWRLEEKERRDGKIADPIRVSDIHAFYNDLSMLYMTQVVPAYSATYDTAVILGGTLPSIRQRLDFLVREWNRGVRFKKIVFLCGERPLYRNIEEREQFFDSRHNPFPIESSWDERNGDMPRNEEGVARFVWAQMKLPKIWRDISKMSVVFVSAKPSGDHTRATREDTLKLFRSYEGFSKTLFVSSQPFISLDAARVRRYSSREPGIVAGPGFSESVLKQSWAARLCLHVLSMWYDESDGALVRVLD